MALFSRRRSSIGLDIGSSHVKLMELSQDAKSGQWSLVNFGLTRLPPEAIVDGAVMNTTVIVDAIRELVQKHRVRTKDVVCSVSGHSVIIKRVNLPLMTTEELDSPDMRARLEHLRAELIEAVEPPIGPWEPDRDDESDAPRGGHGDHAPRRGRGAHGA